jgi:hypothetical protein
MRASPTGNRTTPGLNSIAVLLYARSTLYHNQALRSRARKPVVPPQKTLRSAKLHRGRLEAMHAAIRQSYLLLPPLPTHTNSTTRKRLNSLWMIVRPIAWWCFRSLLVRAVFYVTAVAFIVHEIQAEEDNIEERIWERSEYEENVKRMEDRQRREYEAWLAKIGRYGEE